MLVLMTLNSMIITGTGKTTLARILALHCGYKPVEINASDDRSARRMSEILRDLTESNSIFQPDRPSCIILDEIDGATGGDEKSAIAELIKFVKKPKGLQRPVICIANDIYSKSLKSLRGADFTKMFSVEKTKTNVLATRLHRICVQEGIPIDFSNLCSLCESTRNDIRCCLNSLQFLRSNLTSKANIRFADLNKLGVGAKDMTPEVFEVWENVMFSDARQKSKASGYDRLNSCAQMVSSFGELDVVLQGIHENFAGLGYTDPSMLKTSDALEWFAFQDTISSSDFSGSSIYLSSMYEPYCCAAISFHCSVKHSKRLSYPRHHAELRAKKTRSATVLGSFLFNSDFCRLHALGQSSALLDVLPYVERILAPSMKFQPKGFQASNVHEKFFMDLADTMISLGLTYKKSIISTDSNVDPSSLKFHLSPEVNVLSKYAGMQRHSVLSEEIKQKLGHEIHLEEIRRASVSRVKIDEDQPKQPSKPSLPAGKARPSQDTPKPPSPSSTNENRKPSSPPASQPSVTLGKKRKSTSALVSVMIGSKKKKIDRIRPLLHFKFHEGFSNAVRRNVSIGSLLP
jgi:chromosome transmission fidelity protein 18